MTNLTCQFRHRFHRTYSSQRQRDAGANCAVVCEHGAAASFQCLGGSQGHVCGVAPDHQEAVVTVADGGGKSAQSTRESLDETPPGLATVTGDQERRQDVIGWGIKAVPDRKNCFLGTGDGAVDNGDHRHRGEAGPFRDPETIGVDVGNRKGAAAYDWVDL